MKNVLQLSFYNPTLGKLSFNGVIEEIFNYMKKDPEKFYEIVVGCDSSSDERPAFPVVLVCLKKGQGGRFFLTKIQYHPEKKKFYNLHQRILQEVFISCELALKFREAIKEKIKNSLLSLNYQFQYIHADIGVGGPTKDMIKEVVGLIKSNGFEAKIKPEAFAASVVADRYA
ncbi:MAG: hypothetical protein DRH33_03215 [Candidatus Nealsonbacteria bacterium]|nr:MAG: hypothetical protein DRH33_03215 [Candidatus Nealsonbacteria bacterium]